MTYIPLRKLMNILESNLTDISDKKTDNDIYIKNKIVNQLESQGFKIENDGYYNNILVEDDYIIIVLETPNNGFILSDLSKLYAMPFVKDQIFIEGGPGASIQITFKYNINTY